MLARNAVVWIIGAAAVNAGLLAIGSGVGWFDGVVASATGEPITLPLVLGDTVVGAATLIALRFVTERLFDPLKARRLHLLACTVILLASLPSPWVGLEPAEFGAALTLSLTHVVTVGAAAVASERGTKPSWGWGREPFETRPLAHDAVAVVTGATGGIGGAAALELARRGIDVVGIGRSSEKGGRIVEASSAAPGSIRFELADLSSMVQAAEVAERVSARYPSGVDFVVHAVGTLKRTSTLTEEGIDSNIATSWLSRVQVQRRLHLRDDARVVNVAASESARTPGRLLGPLASPSDLATGFEAHGQAQMANDVWIASLQRAGISAYTYGPGSVETEIRREIPRPLRMLMKPFFWWSTRRPEAAAADIVRLLLDRELPVSGFASRYGLFDHNEHVTSVDRQRDIEALADALLEQAVSG